jgi:hypothetical protein
MEVQLFVEATNRQVVLSVTNSSSELLAFMEAMFRK